MSHVFISYARENLAYAHRLKDDLLKRGFDVWIDDQIDYGDRWFRVIEQAIRDAAAFIVIMTPDADNSEWVEKEILIARREGKPFFPLLLQGREFGILIDVQYADVTDQGLPPDDYYEELSKAAPSRPESGVPIKPEVPPPSHTRPEPWSARLPAWLRRSRIAILGMGAVAVLIAAVLVLPALFPGGNPTPTAEDSPTPGTPVPGDTLTPTAPPVEETPTPLPTPRPIMVGSFDNCAVVEGMMGVNVTRPNRLTATFPPEIQRGCVLQLEHAVETAAEFWLRLPEADLADYNTLTFDVRTDTPDAAVRLRVELRRGDETWMISIGSFSERWQTMTITSLDFGLPGDSFQDIEQLVFVVEAEAPGAEGSLYLDDISLHS